jgi:hypothetical protein
VPNLDCDEIEVPAYYRGDEFHAYRYGFASGWAKAVTKQPETESAQAIDSFKEKAAAAVEAQLFPWRDQDAALAEQLVGPTDEALASFSGWFCRNYPGPDTIIHKPEWHAPKVFRAAANAIARWGSHPTPIPVAERLPGPETGDVDLEANFRAWYQDAHGSAYFGAMPLCVAIGWAQHLLQQLSAPAQPPADGEVRELVEFLRRHGTVQEAANTHWAKPLLRAAELLEQRHPTPIPVAERLPGPEDCIQRGNDHWCWGQERSFLTGQAAARWRMMRVSSLEDEAVGWLPANALPVPTND